MRQDASLRYMWPRCLASLSLISISEPHWASLSTRHSPWSNDTCSEQASCMSGVRHGIFGW